MVFKLLPAGGMDRIVLAASPRGCTRRDLIVKVVAVPLRLLPDLVKIKAGLLAAVMINRDDNQTARQSS